MDLMLTPEQRDLGDAVRALLTGAYPTTEDRRMNTEAAPCFAEHVWSRLADMDILGLPFPEEHGGMGAGPVAVGLVAEEMGRVSPVSRSPTAPYRRAASSPRQAPAGGRASC
ncbi:acyl-CoA dehydrogenase family protein [Streptomyces sp. NPDC047841]|uniref:acyl-CoA dehydrogenase family protein n=1 Tax=Streptomyces sp. NPDC047841 TaxID=3154708 RepID=UPI003453100E